MIYEALTFIASELNQYFKSKFHVAEEKVIISNLINQDGSSAIKDENKVIISLVSIQDERMLSKMPVNAAGRSNPPIYLNLFLLFTTSFSGNLTVEGLKFLASIVGFFQARNVFTSSSGSLDANIDKLIFELHNLNFVEQNNLWASLGAKYNPSLLYKVRMVMIEEGLLNYEYHPVSQISDERETATD